MTFQTITDTFHLKNEKSHPLHIASCPTLIFSLIKHLPVAVANQFPLRLNDAPNPIL